MGRACPTRPLFDVESDVRRSPVIARTLLDRLGNETPPDEVSKPATGDPERGPELFRRDQTGRGRFQAEWDLDFHSHVVISLNWKGDLDFS